MTYAILTLLTIVILLMIIAVGLLSSIRENTDKANDRKLWRPTGAEPANNKTVATKPKNHVLEAVQLYCAQFSSAGVTVTCSVNSGTRSITVEAEVDAYKHRGMKRHQLINGLAVADLNSQGQPAATDFAYTLVSSTRELLARDMEERDAAVAAREACRQRTIRAMEQATYTASPTIAEDAKSKLPKKTTPCPYCGHKRKMDY